MIPSRCADPSRLLIIVDVSIWERMAWSLAVSDNDDAVKSAHLMIGTLCGWLRNLLTGTLAGYIVAACDSRSRHTWRKAMTAHLPPEDQYKGDRPTLPPEYYAECARFERILALHSIPCARAEGWEADDVAATLTREATALGLEVALLSTDKDWRALVTSTVYQWWPASALKAESILGPDEVRASKALGVEPWQIPHLLALVGDTSDSIKGIAGLGPEKARIALRRWGDVSGILAAPPADLDALADAVKDAAKARDKAVKAIGKPGAGPDALAESVMRAGELDALRCTVGAEKIRRAVAAYRPRVQLDLALATLDADAPIELDLDAASVGGFDRPALRALYSSLGFSLLAEAA